MICLNEKYSKKLVISPTKPVLSEVVWVTVAHSLLAIGLFISTRITTELVEPNIFGNANLVLGLMTFGYTLLCAPILQAILRFYPEKAKTEEIPKLRAVITRLLSLAVLISISLMTVVGAVLAWSQKITLLSIFLLCGILTVDVLRVIETNLLAAARKQKLFAIWSVSDAWLRAFGGIIAVLIFAASVESLLGGYLIGSLIAYLCFRKYIAREGVAACKILEGDENLKKEILHYSLPLIPLGIIWWLSSVSDRYIIGWLLGLEQVGIYVAAYGMISRPFLMIGSVIEQTMRPLYFDAVSAGDKQSERKTFKLWFVYTLAAGMIICIGITSVRYSIVELLLAEKYRSIVNLIPWIALGHCILITSNVFEKPFYAHKFTKTIPVIQGAGALASVLVGIPFVYFFGLYGAAIAVPIYYSLQLLIAFLLFRRLIRVSQDDGKR